MRVGISLSLPLHGIILHVLLGILTNQRLEYPQIWAYAEVLKPICGWCEGQTHVWLGTVAEAASSRVPCHVTSMAFSGTQNQNCRPQDQMSDIVALDFFPPPGASELNFFSKICSPIGRNCQRIPVLNCFVFTSNFQAGDSKGERRTRSA